MPETASCFQLGVRFPDGTLQTTAATGSALPTGSGNKVLATPSDGSSGVSALRPLVAADIIPINPLQIGASDTGISRLAGDSLALGNGTAGDQSGSLTLASLSAGNNVLSSPTSFSVNPADGARNNFTGCVGFNFTINQAIIVSALGRKFPASNVSNHVIKLWDTSGPTLLASGTILVASASDANNFKFVSITPVTLVIGHTYAIACDELSGGDVWNDAFFPSLFPLFTDVTGCFNTTPGAFPSSLSAPGEMFSSPALVYTISAPLVVNSATEFVKAGTGDTTQFYCANPTVAAGNTAGFKLLIGSLLNPNWIIAFRTNDQTGWFEMTDGDSGAIQRRWNGPDDLFRSDGILGWINNGSFTNATTADRDTGLSRLGAASLALGNGTLGDTTGNFSLNKVIKYGGVSTVANGIPSEYATLNLTGQAASIGSTPLYAVPSTGAGIYRINYYLDVSTAGVGGTLTVTFGWTDANSAESITSASVSLGGVTGDFTQGVITLYSKASVNITYLTTFTVGTGSPQYELRTRLEYLG